jgi:carboxyl-terminal processing protease
MIKEKDLKNSLKPEGEDPEKSEKKKSGKSRQILEAEQLEKDAQVKRALDILISYGVFSKLNGR